MEPDCDWESRRYDRIKQAQDSAKKHAQTHIKPDVAEQVSPDFFNRPEDEPYIPPTKPVQMGDFMFDARSFIGGLGDQNAQGLQIRAYDPKKPKGDQLIGSVDFIMKTDKKGNQWLESDKTDVKEEYRGKGVAAMMYAFAKSLGNDIKASPYQSNAGKSMWGKWGSDAKNLVGEQGVTEGRNFNDDDWYEIDPKTMSVVNSYGPQAFRNAFGDSQIKLSNGNIAVKGLRAKYMDLDTKKSIGEAIAGLELADVLYNGLEQKYPDAVRQFGAEVVANAVMDAVEGEENLHSMSDVDLTVDEIYSKLAMSQDQGFDKEEKMFESRLYYNVIGTSPAELRKDFGMRKDPSGWFLTADSGKARVMEAQRAFGVPKML
jgi:hypothetical protein